MSQSLARNLIHLVFSTKHREPLITPALRPGLHAYLAGVLRGCDSPAVALNSVADHAHVLFNLSKTRALSDVVEEVKKSSSKWAKENGGPAGFYWQAGYGAFSVSPSNSDAVSQYIANQERHHADRPFRDELPALLTRHGVAFDERYLWD